jgi:hypothetical protein
LGFIFENLELPPKYPILGAGLSCDFGEKVHFFVLLTCAEFGFPTATRYKANWGCPDFCLTLYNKGRNKLSFAFAVMGQSSDDYCHVIKNQIVFLRKNFSFVYFLHQTSHCKVVIANIWHHDACGIY